MRVHDDWTSGKRLTNLAIFSLFVAATLFIAAGWLGWTPARMLAGRDGTWVPNLLVGGLAAVAVTLFSILRLRRALFDSASRLEIVSSLSGLDELTGLIGRTAFFSAIDARTDEPAGARPFCLMLIDLDRFKEINDGFGHQAGDQVLVATARRLRAFWGPAALVARLGGDELAVVIDGDITNAAVATACQQMIAELRKPVAIETWTVSLTCSMGVVVAPRDGTSREELISRADRALYAAKARGRAQAVIFDIEMEKDVTRRRFTERELRAGLINGEIDVEFQPIVSADGSKILGVEALARWFHSYRGRVSPAEFIPIAEETGLIHKVGLVILEKSCRAALRWPDYFVSVNVSPVQVRDPGFPDVVADILMRTGLTPDRLVLEITEGVLVVDPIAARRALSRLRALGVAIALDDFGTGYSSLSYLQNFPLDKIKIDRSFVNNLAVGADAAAIVHCVVALGRALGLSVIAEGVETEEHHRFLQAAGCHMLQGYRFSRPEPIVVIDQLAGIHQPALLSVA